MEWVCFALIIGSMVYSGGIVVEYTNSNLEIRPQINTLEHKTAEWVNSAELEIEGRERLKKEVASTRHVISDLQLGVDEAKLRRQAALLKKKHLEMALLKSSIRSKRTMNPA